MDALVVVRCATLPGGARELARRQVRLALLEALAPRLGPSVEVRSVPGQAPRLMVAGVALDAGVSISHEDGLSIAAVNLRGAVGVDLMRVQAIPDWQVVARDYLGPEVAQRLDGDPRAFARAWTEREARLKCLGLALREWSALDEQRTAAFRCHALDVPDGLVGTLAISM